MDDALAEIVHNIPPGTTRVVRVDPYTQDVFIEADPGSRDDARSLTRQRNRESAGKGDAFYAYGDHGNLLSDPSDSF